MSTWTPISREELSDEVRSSDPYLDRRSMRLWQLIRIDFIKWHLHPWGDLGDGFWVVGLIGSQVLWYNDIEDGFNWSRYSKHGVIDEYWCNQDELHHAIHRLQAQLDGKGPIPKLGPPQPIPIDDA